MVTRTHRVFLDQGLTRARLDEYLAQNFYEAGYSGVIITQSGLGARVHIYAERPALIIGRKGSTIKRLHNIFQTVFGFEGVQITVSEPENLELDARIQAFRIARNIERGFHFRRVAFAALRRIMANGAVGVEITISGKLTAERARFEKYVMGKVYRSGHNVDVLVDRAVAHARLPKGVIGVSVVIAKPGKPADHITVKKGEEVKELIEQMRARVEEGELPSELEDMINEVEEGGEA